jgi:hypothetical protein
MCDKNKKKGKMRKKEDSTGRKKKRKVKASTH